LKRVVEFRDGRHVGLEVKPKLAQLRALIAAAGRDFSELETTSMVENRALSATDIQDYRTTATSV
jgi:hypothetical protein